VEKRVINDLPQIFQPEHDATIFSDERETRNPELGEVLNQFYGITVSNAAYRQRTSPIAGANPGSRRPMKVLDVSLHFIERVLILRNFQIIRRRRQSSRISQSLRRSFFLRRGEFIRSPSRDAT